ncbi:efflux RND transporter periplasmic adaptor subunit [bacterium]|nr:efflux RND transporter periplasmic adaptor subunit [bacterium]
MRDEPSGDNVEEHSPDASLPEWKSRLVLIIAVLGGGLLGFLLLVALRQDPPKGEAKKVSAPVVVESLRQQSVRASVRGFGTVVAERELRLQMEVSGKIAEVASSFENGGFFAQGELFFRIDPRNYEIAVEEAKAQRERAVFEYKLEQGNQIVAEREWELIGESPGGASELSEELALRKPHLRDRRAQVSAAESRLTRAELDLERTALRAPFDGIVVEEQVELGAFVSPQQQLGTFVATDQFQVVVQIPRSELRWLPEELRGGVKKGEEKTIGVSATVQQRMQSGTPLEWKGRAVRLLGDVNREGRMAKVVVEISDPLGREGNSEEIVPLLLGSYVEVLIEGREVSEVYPVPRRAVREGGEVWLVSPKNTLHKEKIVKVFEDEAYIYARGNFSKEVELITNPLPGALEGMLVAVQRANEVGATATGAGER